MKRIAIVLAVSATLVLAAVAAAHELDHPAPAFEPQSPPSSDFNAGGKDAEWKLVKTIATGNPHTDLDFFTQRGKRYLAAGTLADGPNSGGQTIVRLMRDGKLRPRFIASHPSASCISNPEAALGLQHDVEATPKGRSLLGARNPYAVRGGAQLLIDATDAAGRCHDQGLLGLAEAPQGGLELVDVTDVAHPVEIGLTSHIGEAHTVNVDPKRPHIAYSVTSDAVTVNPDTGRRENEDPDDSDRFDLDGFEVVDLSSCMYFPANTSVTEKREQCRPKVYRYRYPTKAMALGHNLQEGSNAISGCHELEIYPSDLLTCGGGNALIALDLSRSFSEGGTPHDYTDDHPRGQPLRCKVRPSSSQGPFATGSMVTDCVNGRGAGPEDLTVPRWLGSGSPSLAGVRHIGSVHHQGRGAGGSATPAFSSKRDIDFNHEAELSGSGELLLATDERGGGVTPPGAACSPEADNESGNGGLHFYRFDRLQQGLPDSAEAAFRPYAKTTKGRKAIYRTKIETQPQGSFCTAHVFQQIPGQNRIFMGWYTQGTQVVDFTERRDGSLKLRRSGYFIPESANTWTSHVFRKRRHRDGSYTYWGATGDFNLGTAGRNAIDVYRVRLPAPPKPARLDDSSCDDGGWKHRMDRGGHPFSSRSDCRAFAR